MAEITFSCPTCGHDYQVDSLMAGKKARCKVCKEVSLIPGPIARVETVAKSSELTFPCPRCGHGFTLAANLAGKRARCKQCGEVFRVPGEADLNPTVRPAARPIRQKGTSGHAINGASAQGSVPPPVFSTVRHDADDPQHEEWGNYWEADDSPPVDQTEPKTPKRGLKVTVSLFRSGIQEHGKAIGLVACLMVLVWVSWSLFPRVWNATSALLGWETVDLANPFADSSRDPEIEVPDIAPDRVAVVRTARTDPRRHGQELPRKWPRGSRRWATRRPSSKVSRWWSTARVNSSKRLQERRSRRS